MENIRDPALADEERQMALVLSKNLIKSDTKAWNSFKDQEKSHIKDALLLQLSNGSSKIRKAASNTLSAIMVEELKKDQWLDVLAEVVN